MLDKANARLVTVGLVLLTIAAIVGTVVITLAELTVPAVLESAVTFGLGAVSALATVRASSSDVTTLTAAAEPIRTWNPSASPGLTVTQNFPSPLATDLDHPGPDAP